VLAHRLPLFFAFFLLGCGSGSGAGVGGGDAAACTDIVDQICEHWASEGMDPGKPCDPPQITANTDYRAACERADEQCASPATTISCNDRSARD
jgi:hypothetical protein